MCCAYMMCPIRELLAYRLNTIHNIHYYTGLMAQMRAAIVRGDFDVFKKSNMPAVKYIITTAY